MLSEEDNLNFLIRVTKYERVYLDGSHWSKSTLTVLRGKFSEISAYLEAGEIKYCIVAVSTVLIFRIRWKRKVEKRDEIQEILKVHPNWDEKMLMVIKNWRKKNGI